LIVSRAGITLAIQEALLHLIVLLFQRIFPHKFGNNHLDWL